VDCSYPPSVVCTYRTDGGPNPLGTPVWATIEIRSANTYLVFEQRKLARVTAMEDVEVNSTGVEVAVFAGTDLEVAKPQIREHLTGAGEALERWFEGLECSGGTATDVGDLGTEVCRDSGEQDCFRPECALQVSLANGEGRVRTGRTTFGSYIFAIETSTRSAGPAVATIERTTFQARHGNGLGGATGEVMDFATVRSVLPAAKGPLFEGELSLEPGQVHTLLQATKGPAKPLVGPA